MWNTVKDLESAKKIISNPTYKNTGKFEPDCFTIDQVVLENSVVVDFGCGVGRNAKYIIENKKPFALICYDYPNMIKLAKEFIGESSIRYIEHPIENLLKIDEADFVLADIVLQHIPNTELKNSVLPALAYLLRKDGRLLINSRGYTIWPIIGEFFTPLTLIDPTKDNNVHQSGIYRAI